MTVGGDILSCQAFSVTLSAVSIVRKSKVSGLLILPLSLMFQLAAKRYGTGRHVWDVPQTWLVPFLKVSPAKGLIVVKRLIGLPISISTQVLSSMSLGCTS